MKQPLDKKQLESLLETSDYRGFITLLIQFGKDAGRPMSYSALATRLGVSARSYPRDIVLGTKSMTPSLLPKFIKAFGLTGDLKSYFIDLVEMSETRCRVSGRSEHQIALSLQKFKTRIRENSAQIKYEEAFSFADLPRVYAALGTKEQGASLMQIEKRTAISDSRLLPLLEKMVELKIVETRGRRYFPTGNHLDSPGLKTSKVFQSYFIRVAGEAMTSAKTQLNSDERLYFSSAFSVQKSKLPQLKTELRELLLRYIDSSEFSDGDKVVSLLCALH